MLEEGSGEQNEFPHLLIRRFGQNSDHHQVQNISLMNYCLWLYLTQAYFVPDDGHSSDRNDVLNVENHFDHHLPEVSKKFNTLFISTSWVNLMAGWREFKYLEKNSTSARDLKSKNVSSTYRL